MYEGNEREIDFGLSKREVRVSEGSSYRESTCILIPEYDQSNAPLNGHHELPGGGGAPIRIRRGRSSSGVQVELKY